VPIRFLTLDEALAIHEGVVARFGGTAGVRDLGLLDSAMYRPRSGYYEDVADMATALFESLLMTHPSVDGNERVAFFGADLFLRMNGWRIEVDGAETDAAIRGLLDRREADFDRLGRWIRAHLVRL